MSKSEPKCTIRSLHGCLPSYKNIPIPTLPPRPIPSAPPTPRPIPSAPPTPRPIPPEPHDYVVTLKDNDGSPIKIQPNPSYEAKVREEMDYEFNTDDPDHKNSVVKVQYWSDDEDTRTWPRPRVIDDGHRIFIDRKDNNKMKSGTIILSIQKGYEKPRTIDTEVLS